MDNEKFADGFFYKPKNENAPSFIDGRIVIKVDEFAAWFAEWQKKNEDKPWLSFDLKTSREGKKYAQVNAFEKVGLGERPASLPPTRVSDYPLQEDINPDDIPF